MDGNSDVVITSVTSAEGSLKKQSHDAIGVIIDSNRFNCRY